MRNMVSLHVNGADKIDWVQMASKPVPKQPQRRMRYESEATDKRDAFRPKFWHSLTGGATKRLNLLDEGISAGRTKDDQTYQQELAAYHSAHAEWFEDVDLANRLLSGDLSAERDIVSEYSDFDRDGMLGSKIEFRINEEHLHAILDVHSRDIVPNYRLKQLQSGRLSESKMPAGEANELYQDYVCSAAMSVAGDLFNMLRREEVYVTCMAQILNSANGHMEMVPILSVRFVRPTFEGLNLQAIDPSDSMRNFVHEMNFKRTSGMAMIVPLKNIGG